MRKDLIKEEYDKYYSSIDFERTGLFKFIKDNYGDREALYLGSSIHISPSFVFPNVTYIDNSELFQNFSRNKEQLLNIIDHRKLYRNRTHINLVVGDYTQDNTLPGHKYDLVLSLFSPGTYKLAAEYLNDDGIFIYLPLPSDTESSEYPDLYQQIGEIVFRKSQYVFNTGTHKKKPGKQMVGDQFRENNVYRVLKKQN